MSNKSLDGVLTKKAHQREKFTEEQIEELIKCSDPKEGFLEFAKRFFYIQQPVQGKCLFEPSVSTACSQLPDHRSQR